MFKAPDAVGLTPTWDFDDLRMFPWHDLARRSAAICFAVMFVTAITMLLNTTGIEFVTRREADLQRELKTLGRRQSGRRGARRLCQLHVA